MTLSMKILKLLALIGLLAILGGLGTATFFFGGFFNVAANNPDPDIVNWALVQVRKASITRRATDRPPASLDDPDMVQAGSVAYNKNGCIDCHGEPGVQSAKFSEGLNPPPDLRKVVLDRRPEELFWVIKNGIKMSAMPSFGADDPPVRDKKIWAIVAFLKKLSSVSDENFKAWNETPLGGYWEYGCGPGRTSGCGPGRK
jgi:mono/diheme cytochrome c family protein